MKLSSRVARAHAWGATFFDTLTFHLPTEVTP